MINFMMVLFLVLLFSGFPVAIAMGIAGTLTVIYIGGINPILIPQRLFMSLNTFTFLAIPFFILAGGLMNSGGITRRIVKFASVLLAGLPGNLAHVTVVTNIIMAGFSGSATADAVAVGSVLIPAMKKDGYTAEFSAGVNAASSCIGPIIPPSIMMVIYGGITGLSVGAMFMGGFIPGLAIGIGIMLVVAYYAKKNKWRRGQFPKLREIYLASKEAIFALFAPVIILGGIATGVVTATEAGVIAVVYSFIIAVFVYKEVKIKQIPKILVDAAINTTIPVLIISCASIVGWVLARQNFATQVFNNLLNISDNPNILYFLIIFMLLLIGLVVEGSAALVIFTPVLFPIGLQLGYDPIHFALIIIITILIGTITPPVGLQLYVAASIAKTSITKVVIWPFVIIMVAVVLIITYYPPLVTFLPHLFFGY